MWFPAGTGDFADIPSATLFSSIGTLDLSNFATFYFNSAVGNFVATSGEVTGHTVTGESQSETVFLTGNFTPEGTTQTAGFTGNSMSIILTLNENGIGASPSFSASGTTTAPAEPTTLALLGVGLLGLGVVRRRRT